MGKFTVEFTIEADSLGHATNRALVALYKGDLDAEDVKVSAKGERKVRIDDRNLITPGGSPPGTYSNPRRGDYVRGGGPIEIVFDKTAANEIGKEALKKFIEKNRKVPEEPHKDALN